MINITYKKIQTIKIIFILISSIFLSSSIIGQENNILEETNQNNPYINYKFETSEILIDYLKYGISSLDKSDTSFYNLGTSVLQIDDGYILTGVTGEMNIEDFPPYINLDIIVIKTDFKGNTIWKKIFDVRNMDICMGMSIRQTLDGGFIIGGAIVDSSKIYALLLKLDEHGNEKWNQTYDGLGFALCNCVQQTNDNGYILTGQTFSIVNLSQTSYTLLLKTDEYGNLKWFNSYNLLNYSTGYFVEQTSDDGFIVTGYDGNLDIHDSTNTIRELQIIKTDFEGQVEWIKNYKFLDQSLGSCIREIRNQYYIISGSVMDNNSSKVLLLKVDNSGVKVWNKLYEHGSYNSGTFLEKTKNNSYIICGYTNSYNVSTFNGLLIKTNENGSIIWYKTYSVQRFSQFGSLNKTKDGYILTGVSSDSYINNDSPPDLQILLLKTNESGTQEWCKTYYGIIQETELEIDYKFGRFIIRNIGDYDAYNIELYFEINTSGLILGFSIGSNTSISKIAPGDEISINPPFLLGFGSIEITLKAIALNALPVELKIEGYLILFFLIQK